MHDKVIRACYLADIGMTIPQSDCIYACHSTLRQISATSNCAIDHGVSQQTHCNLVGAYIEQGSIGLFSCLPPPFKLNHLPTLAESLTHTR